ncbi:MAG: hypothetical protein WBC51_13945 [Vicinamibacterales bacterium]
MPSTAPDVVILSWGVPTKSDRSAQKLAAFLGVEAIAVDLSSGRLEHVGIVSPRTCLIVHADTLAHAADAVPNGLDRLRRFTIDAAKHVFIYGFDRTERHTRILCQLSSGALTGVQPRGAEAKLRITDGHREWCAQFAGLSLESVARDYESCFVESSESATQNTIMRIGKYPFFARVSCGDCQLFVLAVSELVDLDDPVTHGVRALSLFSRFAPLLMFLRGALRKRVWQNENPRACLIIDDPLLTRRYGFFEYEELVRAMGRRKFAASIAFIPWNYRRSRQSVAKFLASHAKRLSLCVHGCDHTNHEFAQGDFASLAGKARLALDHMRAHRDLSGVPFDDVMVFPQGRFCAEAVAALKASNYLATINGDVYPANAKSNVTLRDLLDVAVTRFDDFPLFGRRYPRDIGEFALDLFVGRPAIAVEHHGYFRDGYDALSTFVDRLNGLDNRLEWTNLATICSRACLTRDAGNGETWVRFFTPRFQLQNPTSTTTKYVLFIRRTDGASRATVTVDGRDWTVDRSGAELRIGIELAAGQGAQIAVSTGAEALPLPWKGTAIHRMKVGVRRRLGEFRDNYVDTARARLRRLVRPHRKRPVRAGDCVAAGQNP